MEQEVVTFQAKKQYWNESKVICEVYNNVLLEES